MRLAQFLARANEDWTIDLEYYLPSRALSNENADENGYKDGWGKKLYIDIVVRHGEKYVPIELKYKTRSITVEKKLMPFGKDVDEKSVLANQGAQNEGRYDFWRDVRRLQLVCEHFKKVENGIVVFVTNDDKYYQQPNEGAECADFTMNSENLRVFTPKRHWKTSEPKSRPSFEVSKCFELGWLDTGDVLFNLQDKQLSEFASSSNRSSNHANFNCCLAVVWGSRDDC